VPVEFLSDEEAEQSRGGYAAIGVVFGWRVRAQPENVPLFLRSVQRLDGHEADHRVTGVLEVVDGGLGARHPLPERALVCTLPEL